MAVPERPNHQDVLVRPPASSIMRPTPCITDYYFVEAIVQTPTNAHGDHRYLSDVAEDGGPLAVVPGSMRLPAGPWETLRTMSRITILHRLILRCV